MLGTKSQTRFNPTLLGRVTIMRVQYELAPMSL